MTSKSRLAALRQTIRYGLVEQAQSLIKGSSAPAFQIEAAYLDLLQFQTPAIEGLAIAAGDKVANLRLLVLQGIILNRQRDPLGALAKFEEARLLASTNTSLNIDVNLELAKAYVWLGNSGAAIDHLLQALSWAEDAASQFLVYCRLSDLYAELQRWRMAQHYITLAHAKSDGLQGSVYYTQLLECEARTGLANGGNYAAALGSLQQRKAHLPPYLQFRLLVLLVEKELAENSSSAQAALENLRALPLCSIPESFEHVVAEVLSARCDLQSGNAQTAIAKLTHARAWYADEDLAVRYVDVLMLLAKAYVLVDQKNNAAGVLDEARSYCQTRGLTLHLEKVESCFADLNVVLYPVTEAKRRSSTTWKNRQAYVILEKLGEGGQGSVFRAFDNSRQRIVAFKKLKNRGAAALESLARELRSANAAAIPRIARIIACGEDDDGSLYMVQEFVQGQSLRRLMEDKENPTTLAHYLALVGQTLTTLHAKGVVHGDVKPENIIVTPDNEVFLVDFGLAQLGFDRASSAQGATARYAPPNLAARFRPLPWRDYFALGVMLEECLGHPTPLSRKLKRAIAWPFSNLSHAEDWAPLLR